jgi:hypothetical protein
MTSTSTPADLKPTGDPLRILHISANLLPAEIVDARRANKLRWLILGVLLVVVAALVAWDINARQQTSNAQHDLAQAQARLNATIGGQKQYDSINSMKSTTSTINSELRTLMAQDLPWWNLLPALNNTAIGTGVQLQNVAGSLYTANSSSQSSSAQPVPGISSATSIGSLTLIGTAPDQTHVAAYLDVLGRTTGLANPFLTNTTGASGKYQFTIQVEFTSDLYAGRYTATPATGGK